jgi:hypothetical protein
VSAGVRTVWREHRNLTQHERFYRELNRAGETDGPREHVGAKLYRWVLLQMAPIGIFASNTIQNRAHIAGIDFHVFVTKEKSP